MRDYFNANPLLLLLYLQILPALVSCQSVAPTASFPGIENAIPEDTPQGTVVFRVTATDVDSPSSDLTFDFDSNTFYMQPNQDVILIKTLNFEANTYASFALTVSDGQSFTPYTQIVQISDVNDVKPDFSENRYERLLPEDTPVGTAVFSNVEVNDLDVSNAELRVVCTRTAAFPDACDRFYVNTTESNNQQWRGDIYLQRPLDYETMQETYQLTLTAKDGNEQNDREKTFEIRITDVTDAPPEFTGSFDSRINEDIPLGSYVVKINAVDGDKNDSREIRYAIVDNPGGYFQIDSVSGNITTALLLDRDSDDIGAQGIITLNVTAQELLSDGRLGSDSTTQSFIDARITIMDVNDNPPSFTQTHYSVRMSESIQNNQAIPNLTMYVNDPDGADNAFFRFVFANLRDYEDIFEISPPAAQGSATATLLVKNSSALDYDRGIREYTLEVIAREVRTSGNLSSTAIVTVYLEDANDNAPQFDVQSYVIRDLSELTQPRAFIAALPTAIDIDTGSFGTAGIRYSLIGSGNNKFDIDPLTADLRLRNCSVPGTGNCLDYEAVRQYNLTLIAADNNGTGIETRLPLTIVIVDENDNIPVFTSDSYQYRVLELTTNLTTDQPILATDKDSSRNGNNRIRYSLVTDRSQLFTVDSTSGELNLRRPINFRDGDANGRIRIIVGAGNLLDGSSVVDFTRNTTVDILVEDINNNAPIFLRNYTIPVPENIRPGVEIVQVRAEDADFGQNAAIDYNIVSGAQNTFDININTGVISRRTGAVLDFDVTPSYVLMIRGTDRGNPRLSGTAYVTIEIIDDNNKNPVFNPPTTYANISEDAAIDFAVVAMQAIDIDTNADLRYSFTSEVSAYNMAGQLVDVQIYNYLDLFRIDTAGQVFVNRKLDVSKVQRIIYRVEAVDVAASGPVQRGEGTLIIDIINANNHAPEFVNLGLQNQVYEEEFVGSLVMVVTAVDGDNDMITYQIVNQSLPGAFNINQLTGIVTVASSIDYESVQVISILVRASDGTDEGAARTTDQRFSVSVININDNKPQFSQEYYEAEIDENTTARQIVTTVSATDGDLSPYGEVRYRLPDSVTQFRIDEVSGVIYKIAGVIFDRELLKQIQIPVIAYDGPGSPSRSAIVPVYIEIKDVNDNSPYFSESDIYITLSDELPIGSNITRLYAFDRDIDDSITYSITDDPTGLYTISSTSGIVSTLSPLTNIPDHEFHVRATDRAGNYAEVRVVVTMIGNKKGPEWIFPAFNGDKIVVCENRPVGFPINSDTDRTRISATGAVEYTFFINNKETDQLDSMFRIRSATGEIVITGELDRETRDQYMVQVQAKDADGLINRRYILIEICDRDDNDPEFPRNENGTVRDIHFYIESGVNGCVEDLRYNLCGRVTAYDLDLPENGRIMYFIIGGDEDVFVVDPDTGIISTTRPLDYATRNLYMVNVRADNYHIINGERQVNASTSVYSTANVYIHVLPSRSGISLVKDNVNMYTSIDTQIGECLDTMRPAGMTAGVSYSISTDGQVLYNGTIRHTDLSEMDELPKFSVGSQNGYLCTVNLFNPDRAGFHYQVNVTVLANSGDVGSGKANVWLTENIHKIRIVIDGNPQWVNSHRQEIIEALQQIIGTKIVWIDSVGYYSNGDTIDNTKSSVIIYAVNETTRHLFRRTNVTITYINERINTIYHTVALDAKILRAEDIITTYIYVATPVTAAPLGGGGGAGGFPIGLLVAMLLLLPLLLLPLLLCCLPCLPCGAAAGGAGRGEKYAIIGAAPAGNGYAGSDSYIDEWYEQSRIYNNPAYMDDWDSGSAHMTILGLDAEGKGKANGGMAMGGQNFTEETEEYFQEETTGGKGSGMANGSAIHDVTDAGGGARVITSENMMRSSSEHNASSAVKGSDTSIIVDTLTPSAAGASSAETMLVEEERTERRMAAEQRQHQSIQPLMTSLQTDHNQMSSLSPATIDMLDSASAYNAQVAARNNAAHVKSNGYFSHTATVPRHGGRRPPTDSEQYITSESYESDYPSEYGRPLPSAPRYHEESGMTIILDAQPTRGMEVENVEYEVITDVPPVATMSRNGRSGYSMAEHSSSAHRSNGTIPRNGFTIELEPETYDHSGMVAEREEYVLTDDEGLAPEFFSEAQKSPRQKRYQKTTTRTLRESSADDSRY